jgi:hypothetical protein
MLPVGVHVAETAARAPVVDSASVEKTSATLALSVCLPMRFIELPSVAMAS